MTQDTVPFGHLKFVIRITNTRSDRDPSDISSHTSSSWMRYSYAFVSYASADRQEVLKRVQMLARFKIAFFQDLLHLEPGERWGRRFRAHRQSDVFFLFWSSAAKKIQMGP